MVPGRYVWGCFLLTDEFGVLFSSEQKVFVMDEKKWQSVKKFADYASSVIYDDSGYELDLQFYLTKKCNLASPGCYVASSPRVSGDVLPTYDAEFYLKEFEKVPQFTESVVLTGGEIFTAPIGYVEWISHQVLDRGWGLQLKTNGSWVRDEYMHNAVPAMLRRMNPGRGLIATKEQVSKFFENKPKWLLRLLGRDVVRQWLYKSLPTTSMLSMAVSVDDKLHPEKSVQWLGDIVNIMGADKNLAKKVDLKTFTVADSRSFFEKNVINGPGCVVKDRKNDGNLVKCELNGVPVESYFGDFVGVNKISEKEKIENFVLPALGEAKGRLVYCFYPDKTVGLDSCYLQSVGRVPYIGTDGLWKSFNKIRRDIYTQLVLDYQKAIEK